MSLTQTTTPAPPSDHIQQRSCSSWARAGVPLGLALVGLLAFSPGIRADFVSDSFYFLWIAHSTSFAGMLGRFVPTTDTWHSPYSLNFASPWGKEGRIGKEKALPIVLTIAATSSSMTT